MLYLLFMLYEIMWTLISLPLQMAECLRRDQPDSVANHVKARQSLIERAVTWLATESGWARGKCSAICSGKLCEGFTIFEQCCTCGLHNAQVKLIYQGHQVKVKVTWAKTNSQMVACLRLKDNLSSSVFFVNTFSWCLWALRVVSTSTIYYWLRLSKV